MSDTINLSRPLTQTEPAPESEPKPKGDTGYLAKASRTIESMVTGRLNLPNVQPSSNKMGYDELPALTAFSPEEGKGVTAEELSAGLLASALCSIGLLCGVMSGLVVLYHWWLVLMIVLIFATCIVFVPKITDAIITGILWSIQNIYITLRNILHSKQVMSRLKPHAT